MSEQLLKDRVVEALKDVHDPEIPINLYDLGLIYEIDVDGDGGVHIVMTLTTPNCPVAESMPGRVHQAVAGVEGVTSVDVDLTWEPAWSSEKMTEDAKLALEMMGVSWKDPHSAITNRPTGLTLGKTDRNQRK